MGTKQSRRARHESGNALVLVVIFMVVLVGFAAFCIDLSRVYQQERDMQSATDSAALSGVALLTNSSVSESSVIQVAQTIAQANGVSTGEVAASSIGTIQVGTWNTNTLVFTANTPQSQWNAVLVPAKRSVPMLFAKVLGMSQMAPKVESVAMEGGLGSVTGLIPFAITTNELGGLQFGQILDTTLVSPGDRGKIDLCGYNMSSNPNFQKYMVNGVDCTVSVGEQLDPGPGNGGYQSGFDDRLAANPYVLLPIVDSFPGGGRSADVTIEGFVEGLLIGSSGSGSTWSGQIQIIGTPVGGTIGGPTNAPYAQVRVLVQ